MNRRIKSTLQLLAVTVVPGAAAFFVGTHNTGAHAYDHACKYKITTAELSPFGHCANYHVDDIYCIPVPTSQVNCGATLDMWVGSCHIIGTCNSPADVCIPSPP